MPFYPAFFTSFTKSRNPLGLLMISILILLTGCKSTETETKAELVVFGTLVQITTYTADKQQAENAIQAVEQRFQAFHHEWHAWEKGGIVSKINQSIADRQPIEVADSVKDFILKSQKLSKSSGYLFDPGIGELVALWGFHSEQWSGPPPSDAKIQHWLEVRPSIADLHFEGHRLYSRNPDVRLDFGGNAKGLALDIAVHKLRESGIKNAVVNIGGDMRVIGLKNGLAWSIGIKDPKNTSKAIAAVHLSGDESIVTSGTYQRFFEWQGQRFSHILNPNTGRPASGFASVTVIHPDATTADSAATAILIAGPEHWEAVAKKMGIEQVLVIDQQDNILQTKAMAKRTKLL